MKANVLTAAFVKSVRHRGGRSPDRYGDGHGLLLQVMPSGSKQWVQYLALNGKRRHYGLGGYPDVGLAEARLQASTNMAEARAYRREVHRGGQPPLPGFERGRLATVAQRSGRPVPAGAALASGLPFGQAWEACILERSKKWKDPVTALRSWRADLKHHLAGIAGLPVAAVTVGTLRQVVAPLTPATASKVLRRTGTVFDWAVAGEHRADNPARTLRATWRGLGNGHGKQHRKAIPWADLPAFYAKLRAHGTDGAAGALALVLLTALRSKEGRLARWEEIDLDARVWAVPRERMKEGQPFRVPLSGAACAALRAAGPARKAGLVFTTRRGGPITGKALRKVMADLGADATVHGLRSAFRDWAGETGVARDAAEMSLCHKPGGVEGAYARSDLLERRREVMQAWGAFVTGAA